MTLTQTDIFIKLKSVLPTGWFKDETPIVDSIVNAFAYTGYFIYNLMQEVIIQTRLLTMTDGYLDLFAQDFLGNTLLRLLNEVDTLYRTRIQINLFKEKVTLRAVAKAVDMALNGSITFVVNNSGVIVGSNFTIYERKSAVNIPNYSVAVGIKGANVAARYGTAIQSFEALLVITAQGDGASGYNDSPSGLNSNSYFYYQQTHTKTLVPVQDYLNAIITAVKPIATTIWISYP